MATQEKAALLLRSQGGDPTISIVKAPIPVGPILTNAKLNGKPVSKVRRPGTRISPTMIIVHSTANEKSSAMDERNWLLNLSNDRPASWHYAVDDKQIVEAIPPGEVAHGTLDARANHASIQVEICESGNRQQALRNTAELIAHIITEYQIAPANVFPHRQFQKKSCPRILPPGQAWDNFIAQVKSCIIPPPTPSASMLLYSLGVPINAVGWAAKEAASPGLARVLFAIVENFADLDKTPWCGELFRKIGERIGN